MAIEISVVKSPDDVQLTKVCQIFTERGGSIGRGEGNTWVVDDPQRFISSTHTQIEFDNGQYYLSDVSTNGTFLNGAVEPIGNGNRVLLKHGDSFSLGDYEFQVNINQAKDAGFSANYADPFADPEFEAHPQHNAFAAANANSQFSDYADPFSNTGYAAAPIPDMLAIADPEETDPLAMLDRLNGNHRLNPFLNESHMVSQADNADPMQHAVAWPNVIPDDWDAEVASTSSELDEPVPVQSTASTGNAQLNDLQAKLQNSEHVRERLEKENERLLADMIQLKQQLKNLQSTQANSRPPGNTSKADETLLDAMGLGQWELPEAKKAEISATVGYLMRESIAGLMQTLGFRKKIKEEFRINVTTIQPIENNPLKFSANIEDALENLFVKDNKAYMKPLDAVREGFQGIAEHQIALLAGIQAAFRGMIERLDPGALEKRFEKYRKTGVIKVGQKGKNWESYKEFHQDLVNNIDNSFQYLFGYDFVQAYEHQLQRLLMARKSKSSK